MPLILVPRKSAMVFIIVLAAICIAGGVVNKALKPLIVGLAIMIYAFICLAAGSKKKPGQDSYPTY
ncbi:hypothetical protein SAMN04487894_107193 [Niabella drilacis]|uniref:Uncharacterized protein n=1 Tax=Niabella drilacis (strain DSM 25811 / CCM 8410 / CCUG 62505 / LMG 26954 / E90) TaxID=1285928 RepID=A0A1G6TGL6_NIADE|nr:hypothetical protein SAMN04487894_107193 [Niabella drilacis]